MEARGNGGPYQRMTEPKSKPEADDKADSSPIHHLRTSPPAFCLQISRRIVATSCS
jgi:hypothetical protein